MTKVLLTVPDNSAAVAYTAGLFDGEGHVGVARSKLSSGNESFDVRLNISNTYKPMIDWLQVTWGGAVSVQDKRHEQGHKPCYLWRLTGRNAGTFLTAVLPFLKVRHEQAKLALLILGDHQPATERFKGLNRRVLAKQQKRAEQIRALNKRGI